MRIIVAILLLFNVHVFAQKNIEIHWSTPVKTIDNTWSTHFDGCVLMNNLPVYQSSPVNKYIDKVEILNVEYGVLTKGEIDKIPSDFFQEEIIPDIIHGKSQGKWMSSFSFVPLRKHEGKWEKLLSFDIKYHENPGPLQTTTDHYDWKTTSIFQSGTWYKIAVANDGIHKIDYNYIETQIGVDPSTLDPTRFKIYGNGGTILPQKNSETWFDDPDENAIYVHGEDDHVFNQSDYILFYAQGCTSWELSDSTFIHTKNPYSDTAYYFLNLTSTGNGKRITNVPNETGASTTITYFDDYVVYESDENNVVHSGRNWYGHKFDFELNQTYAFSIQGIRSNPGVFVTTALGGLSQTSTSFEVSLNNTTLGVATVGKYSNPNYPTIKRSITTWEPLSTSAVTQSVSLSYNKGSSIASVGYVDYVRLNFQRDLSIYNNQTKFRSLESLNHPISEYIINNAANSTIWDITDITNVNSRSYDVVGNSASFEAISDELREYVVFQGSNFTSPVYNGVLNNQNIHALETPDFLIIAHPLFIEEAQRLADHRQENDGMKVHVVDINEVYNEFSSGMKDPTAVRNIAKMFYDRDASKFKYLLLMGDCSYDFKDRIASNTNFVPVYESRNSENPITSHSSDDYFALLDDDEGEWCEDCSFAEYLDIGVGRIPAKSVEEAQGVVNKIIHYDTEKDNVEECLNVSDFQSGKWKNEVVLIADDSDGNSHLYSAESIYNTMQDYPEYHVDKIYIDAFEQISGAGGQTAPAVKDAINKKMERGALIFNYSGHGGELGLSHEGVISVDQIRSWDNFDNMPLMFTATCEFGRYDDPERTSAGEYTLLNDKGGVVAIVTTTRPVYTSQNNNINRAFFQSVFSPIDSTTNEMPRLGDVMRNAKNGSVKSNDVNNRNFALLGDPSMKLAYPKEHVYLTSINNTIIDTVPDTLNALSKITMGGEVRNASGALMTSFNGVIEVSVFDKLSEYRTLGDEGGSPTSFDERDTKIFEGLASVNEGKFQYSFIVPKDIRYTFGKGKVLFYASSPNLKIDANGSNQEFVVGGTSNNIAIDETPPEINLYMNDESFVFGGTTNESPILLAKLYDENGINTTGVGIGHEINAILDNASENSIVLNDYYTSELDEYQRGVVKYPFEDLPPGNHKISLKAWDTYNNSNESILEFIVVSDADLALDHVLNYPNPFTTNTTFHFDHNRACDDLQVMVQIYTVSGKLIKTLQQDFIHAPTHISGINWDGNDDFGKNIGRGVYVYKVKVRSLSDGKQVQEYQKLVILK